MAATTSIIVDRDFIVDAVDPRLFGSFVEHLGRAVYGGIYEPGHPTADANGFRKDVLALVKELGVTVVRYPGGNFVSGYRWEDGVGPKEKRPRRRELAWMSTETNDFGTDEFIDWCRLTNIEPMMAVNLGTRGPAEAADFYEYCNHPSGTTLAEMRTANGHDKPHDVRLWCLGNEADGPWQMGQKPADEYGRQVRESAKLMHTPDPSNLHLAGPKPEFIACGSSGRWMGSYGQWDQEVLEQCFDKVDYLSLHCYASPKGQETSSFLAFNDTFMAPMISEISAICDAVAARRKSTKRIHLSFDEWNVWSYNFNRPEPAYAVAPSLLEDVYTLADALCVGGMLTTLLNHCNRVKIGCLAQLVNVIAPIMTRTGGPAWRQTTFFPFAHGSKFGRGTVLRQVVNGPTYRSGDANVTYISSSIVCGDDGSVTVFALNRDIENASKINVELRSFPSMKLEEWIVLDGDLQATNTEEKPENVKPRREKAGQTIGDRLSVELPKGSWNVLRLKPAK